MIVADNERQEREGYARLEEARSFAKWSKQDRESRLPELTREQEQQMVEYLRLVEAHGWNKSLEMAGKQKNGCIGCPFLDKQR